jgi:hypothetical protein
VRPGLGSRPTPLPLVLASGAMLVLSACQRREPAAAPRAPAASPAPGLHSVDTRIGKLEFTHDFADGYPTKESVETLYDERDFQRACQAYLWAIPAVSFAEWQRGQESFGAKSGDIAALLSYDDRLGVLTPNATTPYYIVFADLTNGPLVSDPRMSIFGPASRESRSPPATRRPGRVRREPSARKRPGLPR